MLAANAAHLPFSGKVSENAKNKKARVSNSKISENKINLKRSWLVVRLEVDEREAEKQLIFGTFAILTRARAAAKRAKKLINAKN